MQGPTARPSEEREAPQPRPIVQVLLERASEEHAKLQRVTDALDSENRELRRLLAQQRRGSSRAALLDSAEPRPAAAPQEELPLAAARGDSQRSLNVQGTVSSWPLHGRDDAGLRRDKSLATCLAQQATRRSYTAADRECMDRCVAKLQATFGLLHQDCSVTLEHFSAFLEEKGCLTEARLAAMEEVFEHLGSCDGLNTPSPDVSISLPQLAKVVSAENPAALMPGWGLAHEDALKTIREHIFHEDVQGKVLQIMHLGNVVDLEPEDSKFDRTLDFAMNVVILMNAVSIGWFSQTKSTGWDAAQIVDLMFTVIFSLELCVKLARMGPKRHFLGREWAWNVFDAGIVLLGVSDLLTNIIVATAHSFNPSSFTALRMIRLARVARLLRVVRVSVFRELKLMLSGLVGMVKTLAWVFIVLLLAVYILGVCLVQLLGGEDPVHETAVDGQEMLFSSLTRCMYTVFRCLVVGDCTTENGTPITLHLTEAIGWPYTIFYCMCCVLMNYGLGSLITALVVDSTLNAAKKAEFRNSLKEDTKKFVARRLRDLTMRFVQVQQKADADLGIATSVLYMSRDTFVKTCQLRDVAAILTDLDIDESDSRDLFDALDSDCSGHIMLEELIDGILRMRGKAFKSDVVASRLKLTSLNSRLDKLVAEVLESHRNILSRLPPLPGSLEGLPTVQGEALGKEPAPAEAPRRSVSAL